MEPKGEANTTDVHLNERPASFHAVVFVLPHIRNTTAVIRAGIYYGSCLPKCLQAKHIHPHPTCRNKASLKDNACATIANRLVGSLTFLFERTSQSEALTFVMYRYSILFQTNYIS